MNNILNIPSGKKLPDDIYVIIEIPSNNIPIKYEISKKFGEIFVDRFIQTPVFYPCNYGYINNTLSLDNDPIDVLVPTPYPIQIKSIIRCYPIGALKTEDESGIDTKIIALPHHKITKEYTYINDIKDLPKSLKSKIEYFFNNYKKLEKNKWSKVNCWINKKEAKYEIIKSSERFKKKLIKLKSNTI